MKTAQVATKIIICLQWINALRANTKNLNPFPHLKAPYYSKKNAENAIWQMLNCVKIIAKNANLRDFIELICICIHFSDE